ncbi:MAG TPA: class II aldolase/adducin family protein [Candidatus Limnocylindrales bacterium]|nr:class II aldolase/adducin family protein [Candidatus Limnocylindrales bacterium]
MGKYDAWKRQVLEVSKRLSERGYFGTHSGSAGNVSALVDGEEAVVVTPSTLPYDDMQLDDLCVVDFDLGRIEGHRDPSIETPMHIACYRNRRDVSAVIHTHQINASVLAVLNKPIPALFDEVVISIGPTVEVAAYGLSGSEELLSNVVARLSNRCHCYLLQNHGALAVGPNLEKTFTYVELLEKVATIYVQALATGQPITTLPEPLTDALFGIVTGKQDMEIARKDGLRGA